MNEILQKQVETVQLSLDKTKSSTADSRETLRQSVNTLISELKIWEEVWAGDWTENTDVYDLRNSRPDPYLVHITEDYITKDLKKKTKINLTEIRDEIRTITKEYADLKDVILSELSFIQDEESLKNETELLMQVEKFKWGLSPGDYTKNRRPSSFYVYDPTIINRGLKTPPHIKICDDLVVFSSLLVGFNNFDKLIHRLLRQLEIKTNYESGVNSNQMTPQELVKVILDKFHIVATQLKNRHSAKPTLIVDDEYDVQDLLNALLYIHFEDIRKEEYTPSYAGGSTRIDFLLKREKILIEVKKTRDTLKDKEIGNQLIIDIAHYKSHPDCKHLICFVYDPHNLVVNPRGLEDDLNKNSSDDFVVEVFIKP